MKNSKLIILKTTILNFHNFYHNKPVVFNGGGGIALRDNELDSEVTSKCWVIKEY